MSKSLKVKLTFVDLTPDSDGAKNAPLADPTPDVSEFLTDAEYIDGERCELIYKESPELGMGSCTIKISWLADQPGIISIMRSGEVETVMTFEQGKRYISSYTMPGMAFELCTRTIKCKNNFDGSIDGELYLDYVVEVRGGFAGRRKMTARVISEN